MDFVDVHPTATALRRNGLVERPNGSPSESPDNSQVAVFQETVRQAAVACSRAEFEVAVQLYGNALQMDPRNHILYSNRSAAFLKLGLHQRALADAVKSRELNPTWPKAYYREGVALQHLGRHAEALAAYASGLSQVPQSDQMLESLIETALNSPLRNAFEPTYKQLQAMRLDRQAFVITSVIGQELLDCKEFSSGALVLEAALAVGTTCSLKLRGSVLSALSSAYWALNNVDKAISYMQQDLTVAKALGDIPGECRAHANLGSAYFSKGCHREALQSHSHQLVLAMRNKDTLSAAQALTSLGHVHTALGDLRMALESHQQCVQLVREVGNRLLEARETGNVGAVYMAMGDIENAIQCHYSHLSLAKGLGNRVEEAKATLNLGVVHHCRREYEKAIEFFQGVLRIIEGFRERSLEARALAGLGHAFRALGDASSARKWYEKQLDLALASKDRANESRALSNLGQAFHLSGDYDAALKLHQQHLRLVRNIGDANALGKAYGNIARTYAAQRCYKQAIKFHNEELRLAKEASDRSLEGTIHGNLAVSYQTLGMHEQALAHYNEQLTIARQLNDVVSESCALTNLGSCHSSKGEFAQAIPYYEDFLRLSQELNQTENEVKACHFLGYAHFCLGNHEQSIPYYEQALKLNADEGDNGRLSFERSSPASSRRDPASDSDLHAMDSRPGSSRSFRSLRSLRSVRTKSNKQDLSRAFCNLGLARAAIGDFERALICQRRFFAVAQNSGDTHSKFRALGNIGEILMKMGNKAEAIEAYEEQIAICQEDPQFKTLEANSYSAMGNCYKEMRDFESAIAAHSHELQMYKELGNLQGECRAQESLGKTYTSAGNFAEALSCFQAQLQTANELRSPTLELQALTNVGVTRIRLGQFDDALATFQRQATLVDCMDSSKNRSENSRQSMYVSDPYSEYDSKSAIERFELFLRSSLKLNSARDQEREYGVAIGSVYGNGKKMPEPADRAAYSDSEAVSGRTKRNGRLPLGANLRLAQEPIDVDSDRSLSSANGNIYAHMEDSMESPAQAERTTNEIAHLRPLSRSRTRLSHYV